MLKVRSWLSSLLVLAITASPVMAANNDAKTANDNAASTASADPSPAASPNPSPSPSPSFSSSVTSTTADSNVTALLGVLVMKGVLAPNEANSIRNAAPTAQFQALVEALSQKGLVSAQDLSSIVAATPDAALINQAAAAAPEKPAGPTVIPAVAPTRVLPLDPPAKDGLIPAFKLGAVRMTPYGFIKSTEAHDTSDPRGDDFILPGFLNTDTGPNPNPSFHIKARGTRFGANLEWPDAEHRVTITGKIEADFEGNFSRADNRNVSSIRSNALQLRLAYARLDFAATDKTDLFMEGGQDWTIFGSSALPNLLETTLLGAYWGNTYERSPQFRFGLIQKFGGSRNVKFSPEFAIMMPSEGNLPADATICNVPAGTLVTTGVSCTIVNGLGNQLGYGERQGADSGRPEAEARAVLQWQLDTAPAVAPAQLIVSGFDAQRTAQVLRSAIAPLEGASAASVANYALAQAAFPTGASTSSTGYGLQGAIQLPTRWATLVASVYKGADMRFMFAGQTLSNFTDTGGLTNVVTAPSVDRSSTVSFGLNAAGQEVVAPQRSIRAYGGFVNLGLPLSRWFNADPKGRNAGWTLYLHHGLDAVQHSDFFRAKGNSTSQGPYRSNLNAVTLYQKINPWCTFGYEFTLYESYALPNSKGEFNSTTTGVSGVGSRTWRDFREEIGPVFTF